MLVVYQAAMRTALDERTVSICRELQDVMTMKIEDNYDEFMHELAKLIDALVGRGIAPAGTLRTLLSTLLVHGCRVSSRLVTTLSEERRRPIWCDYQDLGPELRLVLIKDYEDHSADKDIWPLLAWGVAARRSRSWLASTKERRPRLDRPHQRRPRTVGQTAIDHLMCSNALAGIPCLNALSLHEYAASAGASIIIRRRQT